MLNVVFHDPGRYDEDRFGPDVLGNRCDQLDKTVAINDLARSGRKILADRKALRTDRLLAADCALPILDEMLGASEYRLYAGELWGLSAGRPPLLLKKECLRNPVERPDLPVFASKTPVLGQRLDTTCGLSKPKRHCGPRHGPIQHSRMLGTILAPCWMFKAALKPPLNACA